MKNSISDIINSIIIPETFDSHDIERVTAIAKALDGREEVSREAVEAAIETYTDYNPLSWKDGKVTTENGTAYVAFKGRRVLVLPYEVLSDGLFGCQVTEGNPAFMELFSKEIIEDLGNQI